MTLSNPSAPHLESPDARTAIVEALAELLLAEIEQEDREQAGPGERPVVSRVMAPAGLDRDAAP